MIAYALGGGGSIRALGAWAFVLWVVACLIGIAACYRRGRILSAALAGTLAVGFFGGFGGAIEPRNAPLAVASLATVGMFLGLAAGLAVPRIRRVRSGSRRFFVTVAAGLAGAWVAALLGIQAAMRAPWNCAAGCHLDIAGLASIDALALCATAAALAMAARDRDAEPALGPSEAVPVG